MSNGMTRKELSEHYRKMGLKGGKARAAKLSKARRREIAAMGGRAKAKGKK